MFLTISLFICSVLVAIIGYFLNRFFNSMDRLERAVQEITNTLAVREENLKQARAEIHTLRKEQHQMVLEFTNLKLLVAKNLK